MGQFKPMVKMMTTEPSVELKLKKGGTVKKMDGGIMGALANAPAAGGPATPAAGVARRMAARKGRRPLPPTVPPMAAPAGGPMIPPAPMKNGGETPKMHAKEMKKLSNLEKEMKHHESQKASKAHKGLKTGGVVKGQGGYKDGGVVNGQGGFKKGGMAKKPFATGGKVESGAPVAMPKKPASAPVHIDRLAGTFRKGGDVNKPSGKKC
jgi:hypothetical protein